MDKVFEIREDGQLEESEKLRRLQVYKEELRKKYVGEQQLTDEVLRSRQA